MAVNLVIGTGKWFPSGGTITINSISLEYIGGNKYPKSCIYCGNTTSYCYHSSLSTSSGSAVMYLWVCSTHSSNFKASWVNSWCPLTLRFSSSNTSYGFQSYDLYYTNKTCTVCNGKGNWTEQVSCAHKLNTAHYY